MAQTDMKGRQWSTQGRREAQYEGTRVRVTQQRIPRQASRCGFLGTDSRGPESLLGSTGESSSSLRGFGGRRAVSWLDRRPRFRRKTGLRRNWEEEGGHGRNTRNKECKAPRRSSTWEGARFQSSARPERTGRGRALLTTWGGTVPPRCLKFG